MTTLILRKDKSGAITGVCGAKCYNAKGKKCHCVCAGINHGLGLEKAKYKTDKNRTPLLQTRKPGDCIIIQLQTQLFLEEWL